VPGLDDIIAGALDAGALGAFLSGAGPTVMALFDRGHNDAGARIGEAMAVVARRFGLEGGNLVVEVNSGGAEASALPPEAGS
jgi:homoserine kinase